VSGEPNPNAVAFAQLWADSTARVLEQLHGAPIETSAAPPDAGTPPAEGGSLIAIRATATGAIAGTFSFALDSGSAVRLAQLLMQEPLDPKAELNDANKDALGEVFRQFAGIAATSAKSRYGAPTEFTIELAAEPIAEPAHESAHSFKSSTLEPLAWRIAIAKDLAASIAAAVKAGAAAPATTPNAPAVGTAVSADPAGLSANGAALGIGSAPENLGLLLDVTLDAHLRFGQRQMLLREILDLRAGSVIELDRRLQEPAELLVSGRVVARGEVVIVDGSYGIRITDILQPAQRLTALKT
jgi:flagellar motor switch protein FliN/FliY